MHVANVIVDVPTLQTNRPYSYRIPDDIPIAVQRGMRVSVPFGRGNRCVQGIVLEVTDMADTDTSLKAIQSVEDVVPVLNEEQLLLADDMAQTTFSFKISCLQAMLPTAMRNRYDKWLYPTEQCTDDWALAQLPIKQQDAMASQDWPRWQALIAEDAVIVRYEKKHKAQMKTQMVVTRVATIATLEKTKKETRAQAKKQHRLLQALIDGACEQPTPALALQQQLQLTKKDLEQAVEKGWLSKEERVVFRPTYQLEAQKMTTAKTLNDEQRQAFDTVVAQMDANDATPVLIEGVTGSGKTEIYLQLIAHALNQGKTAMLLIPEIMLTPQMIQQLVGRFGDTVAVLHSSISEGEQYDEWRRIKDGQARVVLGTRSAVFAPLQNIGMMIMDEEHDSSYKQDDVAPRYHARDILIWRAAYHHCPVVLGSATPSLESRARAMKGNYKLCMLQQRANPQAVLPKVEVVDMKAAVVQKSSLPLFSPQLMTAIEQRLQRHEQMVLLLNRRGYASYVLCEDCGNVLQCPHCDVSMTYHKTTQQMKCHYCGYEAPLPKICPHCQSQALTWRGTGTQQVEEQLQTQWPDARIVRMDVDTTRRKGARDTLLQTFREHQADILLGTQMIAKGLDFPNVTLVGVLNADTSLYMPDFRASERTFQLLMQVGGRAGRSDKKGEVILQTYNPQHYAIQFAKAHQYEAFYRYEMQVRHLGDYPPYTYTIQIVLSHKDEQYAAIRMNQITTYLKETLGDTVTLLGPSPRAISRVNDRYYYQLLLKYKDITQVQPVLQQLMIDIQQTAQKGLQCMINQEPNQLL